MNATIPYATAIASLTMLAVANLGCGKGSGPPTFPVGGTATLEQADPNVLAGHTIEFVLDGDPAVRSFAEIQANGSFELASLRDGAVYSGALAGTYRVRLILSDDNPDVQRKLIKTIDPSSFNLEKTPLVVQVPASDPITISFKRK